MIQDISTKYGHKDNLTRGQSPCEVSTSLGFVANEVAARCQRSGGSSPAKWRLVVSLLLMLVVGVCGVKAQVTLTTDESNPNYYLIQSYVNTAFYMCPNGTNVNTLNILNDNMKWFFLDAGKENEGTDNEIQYYYICRKNGNEIQYMYFSGPNFISKNNRIWIELKSLESGSEENYKFYIAPNATTGAYNIIPKGTDENNKSSLNKQGGNAGTGNVQVGSGLTDEGSNWYFIAVNDFEWNPLPECFTVTPDDDNKVYYRIKSQQDPTYFIKPGDTYVQTSNSTSDEDKYINMVWYFKEAESNGLMTYYYIVHAATGKYLRHRANGNNTTELIDHLGTETGDAEKRFQFIVVRGANDSETHDDPDGKASNKLGIIFNIVPKMLENSYTNSLYSLTTSGTMGSALKTEKDRFNLKAHWVFESTSYANVWADPEITCDLDGRITITQAEGTNVRYTITNSTTPPTTPTGSDNLYNGDDKPQAGTGFTTIKARAIGGSKEPSNVVTKTIVFNPSISLTAASYTYTGLEQEPISSVDVGTSHIDASEYTVTYKKNNAIAAFKDAGTYTMELTDVDGGDYIVYGSTPISIGTASLSITAKPKEITYGDAPANDGVSYTGFVNSETESVLGGSLAYDYSYTQYGNVGDYTITPKGLTSDNYEISFVAGPLTVSPATATITADAKGKVYGAAEPTLTATVTGKKREADEIIYTVSRAEGETAGDYTIIPSGEAEQGNYTVNYVAGTFTISQKALTVTANNNSITYGDVPAGNGVIYGEFVGEETAAVLSGSLDYDYSYAQYDDVGNYTITPKGLSSTNYAISFVAGTLTVNQRETDIEWGNTSLGYNGSPQTPIATATNVVNNDEVTVTVTGAQTNVGTDYIATATGFTGTKAGNYVLVSSNTTTTFSIGTGTFTPTVSIDGWTFGEASNAPSVSGNMSGGDVTYTYSVKGENNYSSTVPTNAGDYTVKVAIAASGNYDSAEATKDFTISPKSIGDGKDLATEIDIKIEQDGDDVKVTYVKDGETTLVVDNDYSVSIDVQGEDYYVIVTGLGNYTGSAQGLFVMSVFTKPTGATEAASVYQASSDLAKPNDITPYIVRKVNPSIGTMVITPIDYIPKDVPVLMLRTGQATGFLASPKEDATAEITAQTKNSNLLKVAPEDGVGVEAAQVYMFYLGEFVLTKKGTITNGKFFLYNPNYTATPPAEEGGQQGGSGNAPSLSTLRFVIEEEPTGIVEMRNEKGEMRNGSDWFTLDGRKLNEKPTQPGLYIWNGRKTIINRK